MGIIEKNLLERLGANGLLNDGVVGERGSRHGGLHGLGLLVNSVAVLIDQNLFRAQNLHAHTLDVHLHLRVATTVKTYFPYIYNFYSFAQLRSTFAHSSNGTLSLFYNDAQLSIADNVAGILLCKT